MKTEEGRRREGQPAARPSCSLLLAGSLFLILHSPFFVRAATNASGPDEIPPLRPPHGELAPAFWEQHGLLAVLLGLLLLGLVGAAAWYLLRPRPPVVVPPEARARQALETLRQQAEDGLLLSRVSHILRHYVTAAFGLPPGELTTAEFCRAIAGNAAVGPDLSAALGEFLRQCDQRKFAPPAPAQPLGAVTQALALIDQAHRRRTASATPPSPNPVAARPGNSAGT